MKPVGEPDAGNPHVRFDERGWETERCRMAQATAPILDSTEQAPQSRRWRVCLLRCCGQVRGGVEPPPMTQVGPCPRLNQTSYVEGQNVTAEYHWLENQYDRLSPLMADLVRRQVAVISTICGKRW
jgi:hypothetical protein